MHRPVTEYLRKTRGFSKLVTVVVLAAFLSLTLQPLALAANLPAAPKATAKAAATATDPAAQLAQTLEATEAKLGELIEDFTAGRDPNHRLQDVKQLHQQLKVLDQAALQSFTEVETHIKAKALPPVILDRHTEAVKSYTQDFQTLTNALTALEATPDNPGRKQHAEAAFNHLKEKQKIRAHTPVDPNNLPFRTPDGKVRPPNETPQAFRASLFKPEPVQVASTELTAGMLSTEMLTVAAVAAAPTPADLAPTEDVQITPEIQALAVSLNNNPVKIHNWVRNNIKFLPTYGSIQGSQMTLESKQGNAFDTASLLIALLRASGIHARYVYGTVQIPVEKVMNWVGGVTVPEAAQQLLGQGGIPNIALAQGGKITHIKLEHVWVEAWVDFEPSWGAVHKQGDTWVPMDGSFKQYQFTQGFDIRSNVPFDAAALVNQMKAGATINETEGWVKNINSTQIQTTLTNYQTQVQAYVNTAKPDASVGDILGTQTIIQNSPSILAASLPYKLLTTGSRFSVVPDNFRHKFRYNLYASEIDRLLENPVVTITESLPKLAGAKLTLTFRSATAADQLVAVNLLKDAAADPSAITGVIPAYLIHVVPELKINGNLAGQGASYQVGAELLDEAGLYNPARGWSMAGQNVVVAGESKTLAVDTGYVSDHLFARLSAELAQSRDAINAPVIGDIDPEKLVSNRLFATLLTYFRATHLSMTESAAAIGVITYRMPSFGSISAALQTSYFFGVPRQVQTPGYQVDIDSVTTISVSKDGNRDSELGSRAISGQFLSLFEGYIPQTVLSDQKTTDGVSAVALLARANLLGQATFSIDSSNASLILSRLTLPADLQTEISNAISVGRLVLIHEQRITVGSWSGFGYVIHDQQTGAAAYKISGGLNGGGIQNNHTLITDFLDIVLGWARDHNDTKYLKEFAASPLFKGIARVFGSFLSWIKDSIDYIATGCNVAQAVAFAVFKVALSSALVDVLVAVGIKLVFLAPFGWLLFFAIAAILISIWLVDFIQRLYDRGIEWLCKNTNQ